MSEYYYSNENTLHFIEIPGQIGKVVCFSWLQANFECCVQLNSIEMSFQVVRL